MISVSEEKLLSFVLADLVYLYIKIHYDRYNTRNRIRASTRRSSNIFLIVLTRCEGKCDPNSVLTAFSLHSRRSMMTNETEKEQGIRKRSRNQKKLARKIMFVRLNDDQALVYPIFITGRRASSYRRDDRNKYTSHTVANVSLTSRIAADDH